MASMMKHFLNGTEINPVNWKSIGIKINFVEDEQGSTVNELTEDTVVLANEAKQMVVDHLNTTGICEGIPYMVKIGSVAIDMYIDLTEGLTMSGDGDDPISVKIKKRKSWAKFKENADDLSFEAINKTNPINTIKVPYVVVPDNQGAAFIAATIGTVVIGKALHEATLELAKGVGEFVASLTPIPTVTVGLTGPTIGLAGPKFGAILLASLKLALRIAYFILVMLLFINMINRMLQIISPSVHNLKGSTVLELINKGCAKLGYTFQSSILSVEFKNALSIVPVPLVDGSKSIWQQMFFDSFNTSYNEGYPTASDTTPTLGKLIDAMLDMFNGKIWVDNGVVKMERRDNWINVSSQSIKNTLNVQEDRVNQWKFNSNEIWKRYLISYQVDHSDLHTTDNMDDVHAEYSTEPLSVVNSDLVNIKGLSQVNIPFSYAARKNSTTELERTFKVLSDVVNTAGSILGGGKSPDAMKSSIGVMMISQQHYSTTKIIYNSGGGRQPKNYKDYIGATALYNKYHAINNVKDNFKRIETSRVAFSSQNLDALQGNNYMYDEVGNLLELLSFEWNNETKTAEISFATLSNEANNTKTIKTI